MKRLTREQAAIIGAYTGILAGPFSDLHEYAEKKLSKSIFTHDFAGPPMTFQLRQASEMDFVTICAVESDPKSET